MFFGICPRTPRTPRTPNFRDAYLITYGNFMIIVEPWVLHELGYILIKNHCKFILPDMFSKENEIHSLD